MIEFKNLVKRFGTRTVLNGLNLKIREGEIIFILGTSGTGKSVLLKNLVGLLTPDEGEIWIDEEEVSRFTEEQYLSVRKKCGMVFQHPALFDSSLRHIKEGFLKPNVYAPKGTTLKLPDNESLCCTPRPDRG